MTPQHALQCARGPVPPLRGWPRAPRGGLAQAARSGEREDAHFLGASADDREGRISYLQSRIEKLKELRSRYELEEEAA